jgi:hypothetical protein
VATASRFERFQREIELTSKERDEAQARAESVGKSLHSLFYPTDVYDGRTMQLAGSFAKGTSVRPVRDVDVLFSLPFGTFSQYYNYAGNGQSALLQKVRAQLLLRYPRSEIRGDGPVVKVAFTSGHYVEVVPVVPPNRGGTHWVPRTDNGGSWVQAGYNIEATNLADSDRATSGQTRRLIRMMKIWQAVRDVPIKSIVLELEAIRFLRTWRYAASGQTYDDYLVRDFLRYLISRAGGSSYMPGTTNTVSYGQAWVGKTKTALEHAERACRWEAQDDDLMACFTWREIFGEQFGY